MRKNIGSLTALSLTICVLLFSSFKTNKAIPTNDYSANHFALNSVNELESAELIMFPIEKSYKPFSPTLGKSFIGFKEALGFKESGGDYFTVNTFGYLGKYQFGKETLKMIGVYNTQDFLKNPLERSVCRVLSILFFFYES